MYCRYCGSEIDEKDVFCSKCGTKLKEKSDTEPEYTEKDANKLEDKEVNLIHQKNNKKNKDYVPAILSICGIIIILFLVFSTISQDVPSSSNVGDAYYSNGHTTKNNEDSTLNEENKNIQYCEEIVQNYYETHTYIEDDVFDCDNMAMDVWNLVESKGINAEIAVGNVDMKDSNLEDINHAWVMAEVSPQNWVAIECTGGYVTYDDGYYSGWFFDNPKNYQSFLNVYTTWEYKYQEYENYRLYYNELVEQYNDADAYEQASLRSGLEVARENLHQKEREFLQAETELNALLEYG